MGGIGKFECETTQMCPKTASNTNHLYNRMRKNKDWDDTRINHPSRREVIEASN